MSSSVSDAVVFVDESVSQLKIFSARIWRF